MKRRDFITLTFTGLLGWPFLTPRVQQAAFSTDELLGRTTPPLFGEAFQLRKQAATSFGQLQTAARKAGIELQSVSSYRSFDRQASIWTNKYQRYIGQGLKPMAAIEKIIEYSTIPGTSRHHWGTDLDLIDRQPPTPSDPLLARYFHGTERYAKMKKWLVAHAHEYGFYEVYTNEPGRKGFKYEPWHYSYLPLSAKMLDAFLKIDLKEILQELKLPGSTHFTEAFIARYVREQVMDINPLLR